jgi:hypothetical protein
MADKRYFSVKLQWQTKDMEGSVKKTGGRPSF